MEHFPLPPHYLIISSHDKNKTSSIRCHPELIGGRTPELHSVGVCRDSTSRCSPWQPWRSRASVKSGTLLPGKVACTQISLCLLYPKLAMSWLRPSKWRNTYRSALYVRSTTTYRFRERRSTVSCRIASRVIEWYALQTIPLQISIS